MDTVVDIGMLLLFVWLVVGLWLDSRPGSESESETERGHGIVPSAMQQDMMDGGG